MSNGRVLSKRFFVVWQGRRLFFGKYFRQKAVAPISNLLPSLAANRSNPREAVFKKSALICCLNGDRGGALFAPQNRRPFREIVGWGDYKEVNGLQIDSPTHVASPTWLLIAFCILRRNIPYFVMSFKIWEYVLLEQLKLNSCRRNTYIRFISKIVFPSENDCIILTMQFMKAAQRLLH